MVSAPSAGRLLPLLLPLLVPGALLTGCAPEKSEGPVFVIEPAGLDFGTVPVDGAVASTLVLRNDGTGEIALLSLSLSDGDPGVWNLDWPGATTLGGGAEVEVTVVFAPEEEGAQAGTLLLRTDLPTPQVEVALSGTGGPSEADADGDGFSVADGDCDDDRAEVYPGAEEACDGRDTDCDGSPGAGEVDEDGDGWLVCEGDCDDAEAAVNPGAEEACDGVDTDCDGVVQDDRDDDGDGWTFCDGDCDDAEPDVNPGAVEVCDYLDNDCSGGVDDLDLDEDGFSTCDSGGDCDDLDAGVSPVLVDAEAGDGGDGSVDAPFTDLASALSALDPACPVVVLRAGEYAADVAWSGGALALLGAEADPADVVLRPSEEEGARIIDLSGGAALTLRQLTLTGGAAAEDGGAVRAVSSDVTAERVTFAANTSTAGDGGALALSSGALTLTDCTFTDNSASDDGGAVAALSATVTESGSLYLENQGARGGAAVWEASTGTLSDSTFERNVATAGGGALAITGGSGLLLERLELWENRAGGGGGGLSITDLSDTGSVFRNLWVEGNEAGDDGGGVAVTGTRSAFVLANSDLLGNLADGDGSGLYLGATDAAGTTAWSNIVAYNTGDSGVFAREGSDADVAFTLGWLDSSGADLELPADSDGGDNLVADPLLTAWDPDAAPADQDPSLRSTSPAVDSGPPMPAWDDLDGSDNDRGLTGGPGATP